MGKSPSKPLTPEEVSQSALADLLGEYETKVSTQAPATAAPGTDPPDDGGTAAPTTWAPEHEEEFETTLAPTTAAPEDEEEGFYTVAYTEPPDEPHESAEIAALRAQVAELQAAITAGRPVEKGKPKADKEELAKAFLTEEELDNFHDDPGVINTAMERLAEFFITKFGGAALSEDKIQEAVETTLAAKEARDNFYSDNPELTPHRDYVSFVYGQVQAKARASGRKVTMDRMLLETANTVRKKLNIKRVVRKDKAAAPVKQGKKVRPTLPGGGSSAKRGQQRTQKSNRNEQQKMMDEII